MASITPTSLSCSPEPHSGKRAYLRLDITSISDSDAATNKRYIGTKVTFQGEAWTTLYAWQVTLGGYSVTEKIQENYSGVTDWRTGDILASPSVTFYNNSDGTLTLRAYIKQMFYYGMGVPSRFDNSYYYQDASVDMVCSKLPRYTSFSTHAVDNTTLNTATIKWSAPDTVDKQEYQLDGGSWTTFTGSSYTLTGLTPGSTHKVKTRIRRKDSQLTTTSSELSFTLKSLPSSKTPSDINLGNKTTVSISSVSYLTKWTCAVYDGSTKIKEDTNITETSKELDISASSIISGMLSRHPNDTEWNLTYKFTVVSNGTTYNLTDRTAKISIPAGQYVPTYNTNNVSYKVTDSTSLNITGSDQKVIKGISDVNYTLSAATPNGSSTMSRYVIQTGDKSTSVAAATSMSASITDVEAGSFSVQAIDSRGRSTTISKDYSTYIDYFKPIINTYTVVRKDAILANLVFNITGTFCKWSGLQVSNTITAIKYQYKLKGASSYSTEIACTGLTFNNDTFTLSYTGTGDLIDTTKEYDIKINIYDKLSTTSIEIPIATGKALLWRDLANNRLGIGKKPTTTLDIDGGVKFNGNMDGTGNIAITGNITTPGYIKLKGSGAEAHLKTRGIHGCQTANYDSPGELYLNYGLDYPTCFGKAGAVKMTPDNNLTGIETLDAKSGTNALKKLIFLSSYPVGSIFTSVNNTNPNTFFGGSCGTWTKISSSEWQRTELLNKTSWSTMITCWQATQVDMSPYEFVQVEVTGQGGSNSASWISFIDLNLTMRYVVEYDGYEYSYASGQCNADIQLLQSNNVDPGIFRWGVFITTDKKRISLGDTGYFTGNTTSANWDNGSYARLSRVWGWKQVTMYKWKRTA